MSRRLPATDTSRIDRRTALVAVGTVAVVELVFDRLEVETVEISHTNHLFRYSQKAAGWTASGHSDRRTATEKPFCWLVGNPEICH